MVIYYETELYHHGIKGQRWGVRRFQNPDGSLTEAGRRRYLVNVDSAKKNVSDSRVAYKQAKVNYSQNRSAKNKQAIVNEYRKLHPDTNLSYKEIVRNYYGNQQSLSRSSKSG